MFKALREFKIGRPQIFAGLLLLAFLLQCLWVAGSRKLSDLEYEYIASGLSRTQEQQPHSASPFTSLMAAVPLRLVNAIKNVAPPSVKAMLAIPRPWVFRLPFVIFGLWLGSALWWVARRLFGDNGGYVALTLYCFSPAMVMVSTNIGPEIILAWSSFGLIYTAIGVAHTLYAPPRKWLPRILILGVAIGICLSTALWAFTVVLLAFIFMLYLTPERRLQSAVVLLSAAVIGLAIFAVISWGLKSPLLPSRSLITPWPTHALLDNLGFIFADAYWPAGESLAPIAQEILLALLMISSLTVYGSWRRVRYFGNTAPLITAFAIVCLFALVPGIRLWEATLGLSFTFLFIGGVAADLLETSWHRALGLTLAAIFALKCILTLRLLNAWIHLNPV